MLVVVVLNVLPVSLKFLIIARFVPKVKTFRYLFCQALLLKVCGVSGHYALCRHAIMLVVTTPTEGGSSSCLLHSST